ncbi:SAP30 isoform 1 [Pongo abelii]|uniref:SAP30 isoform 1 n=1 Tax=Pongo abelii TaxID=9601 RepID=A0A2J8WT03_PONAB|nr:SAP30 isoform 1 [Pongo abelii]
MNGFSPDAVSRSGEAAAAVAAVVASALSGKSGLRGRVQGRSQRLGPRGRPGRAPGNCAACGRRRQKTSEQLYLEKEGDLTALRRAREKAGCGRAPAPFYEASEDAAI